MCTGGSGELQALLFRSADVDLIIQAPTLHTPLKPKNLTWLLFELGLEMQLRTPFCA